MEEGSGVAECGSEGARWAIESAVFVSEIRWCEYEEEPGTCGQRSVVVKDKLRKKGEEGVKAGVKVRKECCESQCKFSDSDGSGLDLQLVVERERREGIYIFND